MIPIILLSVFGIVTLFLGFQKTRNTLLPASLLFLLIAFVANGYYWNNDQTGAYFSEMMTIDNVSVAFSGIVLLSAMLILPLSNQYIDDPNAQPAEYYAILLFSLVGAIMMVSYENIIMLFVGIEILSISMYVLTGSHKRSLKSNEAALKYFLMGSFATGILLFGVALMYGATGSFKLSEMAAFVQTAQGADTPMLYLGLTLALIGILFKVSAAPFHFWTPDVYEGAPSLFTAFMSTVVKAAGFGALYKLLSVSFTPAYDFWWIFVATMTVLTLVIANITAVYQQSFKRMMAYSSISHAGYLLIALVAFNEKSQQAILFYSLAYSLATVSAFGVMMAVAAQRGKEDYDSFNGLGKTNPFLAFVMTVSMCSLAGIPLTAGFFGKFFVFVSAVERGLSWLLVVAVLASAVSIYYYFRVVIAMYMKSSTENRIEVHSNFKTVLSITTMLTLLLGLLPGLFSELF
jgi:NADH-quinone oxidoreductase subunit N